MSLTAPQYFDSTDPNIVLLTKAENGWIIFYLGKKHIAANWAGVVAKLQELYESPA